LALSALHLSTLYPDEKEFYQNQAAGLQTQALSIFNSSQPTVDPSNCASMLLFSSFISMHVFFNAATSAGHHSEFLDKFITYLHVHRGVRIIMSGSWHLILQSEIASIIPDIPETEPQSSERECDILGKLFDSTDLNQASIDTCRSAIDHLQWVYDLDRAKPDLKTGVHMVFAWPVLVSAEYTNLLSKRNPEALIILAYYAVLLHLRRGVWIVGDTGRALIQSISTLLGTYWEPWLAWPNSTIATTNSSA
jgi:hypothetical protein